MTKQNHIRMGSPTDTQEITLWQKLLIKKTKKRGSKYPKLADYSESFASMHANSQLIEESLNTLALQ